MFLYVLLVQTFNYALFSVLVPMYDVNYNIVGNSGHKRDVSISPLLLGRVRVMARDLLLCLKK